MNMNKIIERKTFHLNFIPVDEMHSILMSQHFLIQPNYAINKHANNLVIELSHISKEKINDTWAAIERLIKENDLSPRKG
ncbi:MAG: hypothetical protein N3A72_08485 [bacterium]|nr:hypothetical protein [bacterium]